MDTPCTDNDIVHSSVRTDSIRMAFTFWLLSLLVASALAQFPPGSISQFPTTNTFNLPVQTTSTFPFGSTTGTSSGFPTFGSQQQQQIGKYPQSLPICIPSHFSSVSPVTSRLCPRLFPICIPSHFPTVSPVTSHVPNLVPHSSEHWTGKQRSTTKNRLAI